MSLHLVLSKLGTARPMLTMTIKDPKEHLFWVACKAPICTYRVLHKLAPQNALWQHINPYKKPLHLCLIPDVMHARLVYQVLT